MNEEKIKKICKRALELWGLPLQVTVAVEEMSELTKELMKFNRDIGILIKRNKSEHFSRSVLLKRREKIAEEIADV